MRETALDPTRRALVFGGAGLAGLSAAGCCALPQTPMIAGTCDPRILPFLAGPEVLAAWAKPERYFDAHTHFFNAQDVPVAGFLAKSVAHSMPSQKLRDLVRALAPVAEALAHLAPTPVAEYDSLCRRTSLKALSLRDDNDQLDKDIDTRRDGTAEEVFREIIRRSDTIPRLFNEATAAAKSRHPDAYRGQTPVFNQAFVVDSLRDGGSLRDSPQDKIRMQRAAELSAEETQLAAMKSALQFVGFMLSPRHHNLRTYIRRNAEQSPGLPLSGCFAAMVDFNYWLDCPAKASHMEDQVRLHAQLSLQSRGFLMPLVAYNPWVDIQDKDASIGLVEKAIKYHGCVGAKIYPPMGFYPFNNTGFPLVTKEKRPDLEALDNKLAAFYELCDSLGVPVMAHANESNGRDDAHDKLAGVAGWKALRDNEGKVKANVQSLYVNAGHFGGAHAHGGVDWSDQFVDMMKPQGRLNVFADLGYWNELLIDGQVATKLKRELETPLATGGSVADRVMYGSDWHMLSQEPGWENYAGDMANLIWGLDTSGAVAAKVLGGNVLRCYGLAKDSGRGNLERLQKFHADNGTEGSPGWVPSSTQPTGPSGG